MFKRFILALVCLSFTLSGFAAKLTATLQSGDKVTPFYGDNAFVEAYNAAVNGDIITLSPGSFKATNIEKSITVIGTYAFSDDLSEATQFSSSITISGDNVTLEGIRFTNTTNEKGLIIQGADNLTINRCYIALLNDKEKAGHKYHNNTILTDCWIANFQAMSLSQNTVLQNCAIDYFDDLNEAENIAVIENCNISYFAIAHTHEHTQPYAIYRNCYLGLYSDCSVSYTPYLSVPDPRAFYNNCFSQTYKHISTSSNIKSWNIYYGSAEHNNNITVSTYYSSTPVPAIGSFIFYNEYGPVNHKEYPTNPIITFSKIDTKTDNCGNLYVKIVAKARD